MTKAFKREKTNPSTQAKLTSHLMDYHYVDPKGRESLALAGTALYAHEPDVIKLDFGFMPPQGSKIQVVIKRKNVEFKEQEYAIQQTRVVDFVGLKSKRPKPIYDHMIMANNTFKITKDGDLLGELPPIAIGLKHPAIDQERFFLSLVTIKQAKQTMTLQAQANSAVTKLQNEDK